jgi:UDP-2,3-diacylglucosamine pyrophosphatase LpxH
MKNPLGLQQFTDTRERARFLSLLRGRCDMVFMGHAHRRDETEAGGAKFITIEDFRSNRVYCRISVKKTGITREFKRL